MTIFLLYKTDKWNTNSSKQLVMASESEEGLILLLKDYFLEQNKNSPYPLDEGIELPEYELLDELESQGQTQGYDENYLIEEVELNKYLLA